MFFKKLKHGINSLGKKRTYTHSVGLKKLSHVGREIGDTLSSADRFAQKIKGLAVLAGPAAGVPLFAAAEGLHGITGAYGESRKIVNGFRG
jgi:hypothetical protein